MMWSTPHVEDVAPLNGNVDQMISLPELSTDIKSSLIGQSWQAWAQFNNRTDEKLELDKLNLDDPVLCSVNIVKDYSNKEATSSTLNFTKAPVYGHCPSQDEFFVVRCKKCGLFMKPVAHRAHMNFRHNQLLKSPDSHVTSVWSSVISPPPPSIDCPPDDNAAHSTAASTSFDVGNEQTGSKNLDKNERSSSNNNLFEKFRIESPKPSPKTNKSKIKLKKAKLEQLARKKQQSEASSKTALPTAAKSMQLKIDVDDSANSTSKEPNKKPLASPTEADNYVVTQKCDKRLKIVISKKSVVARPPPPSVLGGRSGSFSSKWTIPKLNKKPTDESTALAPKVETTILEHESPEMPVLSAIDGKETKPDDAAALSRQISIKQEDCLFDSTNSNKESVKQPILESIESATDPNQSIRVKEEADQKIRAFTGPVSQITSSISPPAINQSKILPNGIKAHPVPDSVCCYGARKYGPFSPLMFNRKYDVIRQAFELALNVDFLCQPPLQSLSSNNRTAAPLIPENLTTGSQLNAKLIHSRKRFKNTLANEAPLTQQHPVKGWSDHETYSASAGCSPSGSSGLLSKVASSHNGLSRPDSQASQELHSLTPSSAGSATPNSIDFTTSNPTVLPPPSFAVNVRHTVDPASTIDRRPNFVTSGATVRQSRSGASAGSGGGNGISAYVDHRKPMMTAFPSAPTNVVELDGIRLSRSGSYVNGPYQPASDNARGPATAPFRSSTQPEPFRTVRKPYRSVAEPFNIGPESSRTGPERFKAGPEPFRTGPERFKIGPDAFKTGPERFKAGPEPLSLYGSSLDDPLPSSSSNHGVASLNRRRTALVQAAYNAPSIQFASGLNNTKPPLANRGIKRQRVAAAGVPPSLNRLVNYATASQSQLKTSADARHK